MRAWTARASISSTRRPSLRLVLVCSPDAFVVALALVFRVCCVAYPHHPFKQRLQLMQWDHVRTIRKGFIGIRMHLHEEPVNTHSCGCTGERFDEFSLAAGFRSTAAGKLHTVRRIEDDRIAKTS